MTTALGLVEIVRPVRYLSRALAFYTGAVGFVPDVEQAGDAVLSASLAAAWGGPVGPLARLRLGGQTLLLAVCEMPFAPPDSSADDPRFQHIAVVAADMDAAWKRLSAQSPGAITQGCPQRLPASSGGATAVKFRDPDGHPVELIAFAPHALPPHWSQAGSAPTLGIDHSAITVADAERSIAFYAAHLGLRVRARQTNTGIEQSRLDNLAATVNVDVVALAAGDSSPHLELLAYRSMRPAVRTTAGPRTATVWTMAPLGPARSTPVDLHDPDGHLHLLVPHPADTVGAA